MVVSPPAVKAVSSALSGTIEGVKVVVRTPFEEEGGDVVTVEKAED